MKENIEGFFYLIIIISNILMIIFDSEIKHPVSYMLIIVDIAFLLHLLFKNYEYKN